MKNLGLQRRYANRPGAVDRAKKKLAARGRTRIPDRRLAVEGECFFVKDRTLARALICTDQGVCEVKAASDGTAGHWLCISCCVPLANNLEKDSHCERTRRGKSFLIGNPPVGTTYAKHVLAWRSFESDNVEVP